MRKPSARGLAAATAVLAVGGLLLAPGRIGEAPAEPRVETWVTATCGGAPDCARWQSAQALADLLAERMDLPEGDRLRLATAIAVEADVARLDPLLVLAVIAVESSFDVGAVSRRGALGLMQLKPSTLRREAARARIRIADLDDPVANVRAGIRYLRRLLDDFRQDQELALMAYNAGPQRISRLRHEEGGVPEYYRSYARRVEAERRRLRSEGRDRVAMAEGRAPRGSVR
jgi:soluble lytic murein transglycosylase-like protein